MLKTLFYTTQIPKFLKIIHLISLNWDIIERLLRLAKDDIRRIGPSE